MKKWIVSACIAVLGFTAQAGDLVPFKIYNKKGKAVSFDKMIQDLATKEVVLFGEFHDDAIVHWLQLKATEALYKAKMGKIILGAEMFEADMQIPFSRYLNNEIDEKSMKEQITSLWANYKTDYKPLVEFAKMNKVDFIATNVPRYIARNVYRGGFATLDTLSQEVKKLLPQLPIPYDASLPGYKAMLAMGSDHGGDNLPKAQAIKDATMAWSIKTNMKLEYLFLHYNGSYHSNNYEGINWYLKHYLPKITIGTIATVRQKDVNQLEKENKGLADYIICVDETMTRTH